MLWQRLFCCPFRLWLQPPARSAMFVPMWRPRATSSTVVKGVIARCPILESKIQVKVGNFDNNKVKHLVVYGQVKERISALADRLSAQGVDVTALKAYLAVFDQKIQKFSSDYAAYIATLKESQDFVCGKSEGQFRAKWKEAKAALAQVHKDAVDIRTYYAQTLKPELNRIRNQFRVRATTTPESATATDTAESQTVETPNNQ